MRRTECVGHSELVQLHEDFLYSPSGVLFRPCKARLVTPAEVKELIRTRLASLRAARSRIASDTTMSSGSAAARVKAWVSSIRRPDQAGAAYGTSIHARFTITWLCFGA